MWVWINVYRNKGWAEFKKDLNKCIEEYVERTDKKLIIMGDLNARVGLRGGETSEEGERLMRRSKDSTCNWEGGSLVDWVEGRGLEILNGGEKERTEGEFTYVGHRGNTVIDFSIVNEHAQCLVKEFQVGESIDSDHQPIITKIEGGKIDKREGQSMYMHKAKYKWTEEGKRK